MMNLLVILNQRHASTLSPLLKVWGDKGFIVKPFFYEGTDVPKQAHILSLAENADAVMMIVPAKRSPATLINGPVLMVKGKRIPIGLVPVDEDKTLRRFVKVAVEVHERNPVPMAVTLLAQHEERYLKVTGKIYNELNASETRHIFKWTSDIVYAGDMLYGINQGASLCMYVGHGRPMGWAGYYGVRNHHINKFRNKPTAAILSLCCWTAARKTGNYSFCEKLIMEGVTAAGFGALTPTLFTDNTRWAINLSAALQKGVSSVGELIANSCPTQRASAAYRLFGDPTTPLTADESFYDLAKKIKTYE